MHLQFRDLRTPGRHGQHSGTDGTGTLDVPRRVADDQDLFATEIVIEQSASARLGQGGDLVAVLVIVAKRARLEQFPKLEVAQLDFRPQPGVDGLRADRRRLGQRAQLADELPDARENTAPHFGQQIVEPEGVAIEEGTKILDRRLDLVLLEQLPHQAAVGAAGEFQASGAVGDFERHGKSAGKRLHTRAAGVNERAVHIE